MDTEGHVFTGGETPHITRPEHFKLEVFQSRLSFSFVASLTIELIV